MKMIIHKDKDKNEDRVTTNFQGKKVPKKYPI